MRETERMDAARRDACLREYAALLVEVGLNLQPGQPLVIACPVEAAAVCTPVRGGGLRRRLRRAWSWSGATTRSRALATCTRRDATFDVCPSWRRALRLDSLAGGAAFLSIHADDPAALAGVDAGRIARANRAAGEALRPFREATANNRVQWCVAAVPSRAWAAMVFPGVAEDEAQELLLQRILAAVRVRGDGTAAAAWRAHIARLEEVCGRLNALRLRALRYHNALGTELTVALPEGHFFAGGAERTADGLVFVPNMPTEELFTAPRRDGVNGRAVGSLPLVLDGNVVRGFALTFENGRIVRVEAQQGAGAARAGHRARRGRGLPRGGGARAVRFALAQMGTLFYDTLFDENAACHFAFATRTRASRGRRRWTSSKRRARGLNASITHVDFMVGTADLSVTGILPDGGEAPVMRDGVFAL